MKIGTYRCTFGDIAIGTLGDKLCCVEFGTEDLIKARYGAHFEYQGRPDDITAGRVIVAIDQGMEFNEPLSLVGTYFQQTVWRALVKVPYGQTISYKELAEYIGKPKAIRAVASACAANPIAVIVPCHRVVRADGADSGYRWGIDLKHKLLDKEYHVTHPMMIVTS